MPAIFLAGAMTLFAGALLCDVTYARSAQVQWKNFASWLIVGGLTTGLIVLLWAIVDVVRLAHDRGVPRLVYVALLLAIWVLGFVNALVHAGDAWGSMPQGLVLSIVIVLLSLSATALGFAGYRRVRGRAPA